MMSWQVVSMPKRKALAECIATPQNCSTNFFEGYPFHSAYAFLQGHEIKEECAPTYIHMRIDMYVFTYVLRSISKHAPSCSHKPGEQLCLVISGKVYPQSPNRAFRLHPLSVGICRGRQMTKIYQASKSRRVAHFRHQGPPVQHRYMNRRSPHRF